MAIVKSEETEEERQKSLFFLDSLYCYEERWEEDEDEDEEDDECEKSSEEEEEELLSLISKEEEEHRRQIVENFKCDAVLCWARSEAVKLILKVKNQFGFSALTAILAIDYLDRFLSSLQFQREKPWMSQLVAVACLSLAAKVEETQVPLLLDLQVEETEFVFEGKTVQRMELLVLFALQWRMHPVTPYSFMNLIARKIGLKTNLYHEFLSLFDSLLLSLLADSRSVSYLPSAMAAAAMVRVLEEIEPRESMEFKNQILGVLKMSKDNLSDCYSLILELSNADFNGGKTSVRRRFYQGPGRPNGVADAVFSSDCSNDSWSVLSSPVSPLVEPPLKKSKAQNQMAKFPSFDYLNQSQSVSHSCTSVALRGNGISSA